MNDYLPKPISINRLHEKLCIWLKQETPTGIDLPGISTHVENALWNEEEALKRVRHKPERLATLISMFKQGSPKLIEEIRENLDKGDISAAIHSTHTLKGVAGNLSANLLMQAAAILELKLRSEDLDDLMPIVENIIQEHARVLMLFDQYQQANSSAKHTASK